MKIGLHIRNSGPFATRDTVRDCAQIADANPAKYKELARHDVLKGKCWSSPSLSNGTIYIRSTEEGAAVDVSGR